MRSRQYATFRRTSNHVQNPMMRFSLSWGLTDYFRLSVSHVIDSR